MSRKPHEPTPETRQTVNLHATVGTPQPTIAKILGIDPTTLRTHYRDELDLASAKATAVIGGALFNKAKGGDTAAMIFWMKTRAGWRETNVVEHQGDISHKVSADEAFARIASRLEGAGPATPSSTDGAE